MEKLFYLLLVFFIIYNILFFLSYKKISALRDKKYEELDSAHQLYAFLIGMIGITYLVTVFIGLISSQWLLFIVIILILLLPKKYVFLKKSSIVLNTIILVFIVLNKFHLHIDLKSYLLSLI